MSSKIINPSKSRKGNEISLRYPTEADVVAMHQYINTLHNEDTYLTTLGGKPISLKEERQFVAKALKAIRFGDAKLFVVMYQRHIIGVCDIWKEREPRQQHVGVLGVSLLPQFRDEGIGSELMKFLIEQGKEMKLRLLRLTCFANNPRALHIYEKLGFRKAGALPGAIAYKNGYVDQVIMYLPL